MTKVKPLPKLIMNAVFMLIDDLKVGEKQRYNIEVDLEKKYSLTLYTDLSKDEIKTVIEPCDKWKFVSALRKLWMNEQK